MDTQTPGEQKALQAIEYLQNWYEEKVSTIQGAANSDAKTVSLQGPNGEPTELSGRDKNLFLAGLETATHLFGKFPIEVNDSSGEPLFTTDAKRLDFLVENRYRVEKWNTAPSTVVFYVYDSEDNVIAKDFTYREAIDAAMAEQDE